MENHDRVFVSGNPVNAIDPKGESMLGGGGLSLTGHFGMAGVTVSLVWLNGPNGNCLFKVICVRLGPGLYLGTGLDGYLGGTGADLSDFGGFSAGLGFDAGLGNTTGGTLSTNGSTTTGSAGLTGLGAGFTAGFDFCFSVPTGICSCP